MDITDIIYYTNNRGGYALSVDQGEYLMLADGRTITVHGTIWEECGAEAEDHLSPQQKEALREALETPQDEMDQITAKYRRARLEARARDAVVKPIRTLDERALVVKADFD